MGLWGKDAEPPVSPDEQPVPCPRRECKGDEPKTSVRLLRSYVKRNGRVVSVIDGEMVICEECGHPFNINYRTGRTWPHVSTPQPAYQQSTADDVKDPPARKTTVLDLEPRQRRSRV